jgi:quinoprotein dehydrogenase-associated probable ABC transporter substrate-binding protein
MKPAWLWVSMAVSLATSTWTLLAFGPPTAPPRPALRVCADPNNLPFSNSHKEGFENRLAALAARDLQRPLEYIWWPQRQGFVRQTLDAGRCDVVMGIPTDDGQVLTTAPYYHSSYVFVTRTARKLRLDSFDDPRLRTLRVGVPLVGDDFSASPPARALAERRIVRNVVGFSIYGDYRDPNPPARLIDAVAAGTIDVAIAWGPLSGYFARHEPVPLTVTPVSAGTDRGLPLRFAISMGVERGNHVLHDALDAFLMRRRSDIEQLLDEYGVPRAAVVPGGIR